MVVPNRLSSNRVVEDSIHMLLKPHGRKLMDGVSNGRNKPLGDERLLPDVALAPRVREEQRLHGQIRRPVCHRCRPLWPLLLHPC